MGKREIFSLALKSDIPKEKILSIGIEKIKMEVLNRSGWENHHCEVKEIYEMISADGAPRMKHP